MPARQQKQSRIIRVGTRGSPLALVQVNEFVRQLRRRYPKVRTKIVIIKTSGDKGGKLVRWQDSKIEKTSMDQLTNLPSYQLTISPSYHLAISPSHHYSGKGLFVKEIEEALLSDRIDAAVHSLKDVPAYLPKGLQLTAFLKRSDPSDIFISCRHKNLRAMPRGARLGTNSPRRGAQARATNPDIRIVPLRGNIGTRLRKLQEGECDATIIAAAAIKRLGLQGCSCPPPHCRRAGIYGAKKSINSGPINRATTFFQSVLNFVPAIGQGIVCIETRSGDRQLNELVHAGVNDKRAEVAAVSERAFLQAVGGDCHTPLAAHATTRRGRIDLTGQVSSPDGKKMMVRSSSGDDAARLGKRLGNYFISKGAREMMGLAAERPILWTGLSVDEAYLRDPWVIHLPMIEIKPPSDGYRSMDKAIRKIGRYDWVVFTSRNAIKSFFARLTPHPSPHPSPLPKGERGTLPQIAAVGRATTERLQGYGIKVALKPKRDESSRGLAKMFRKINMKGRKVLLPRAKEGLDTLAVELKKMGAAVDVVEAYRTVSAKVDAVAWKRYFSKNPPSKIFFSSPSGVRAFFKYFGRSSFYKKASIVCKGEATRKSLFNAE